MKNEFFWFLPEKSVSEELKKQKGFFFKRGFVFLPWMMLIAVALCQMGAFFFWNLERSKGGGFGKILSKFIQ